MQISEGKQLHLTRLLFVDDKSIPIEVYDDASKPPVCVRERFTPFFVTRVTMGGGSACPSSNPVTKGGGEGGGGGLVGAGKKNTK